MLRKQRQIAAAAITVFWLVMVGLFLYREGAFAPAPEVSEDAPAFQPRDQWMGIYLDGGTRVGHMHLRSTEAAREGVPGYDFTLNVRLETSLFGRTAEMDINGEAWTSERGERSDFSFAIESGAYRMGIAGNVADNRLRATMRTGGETIPLDFPVENAMFPGGGLGMPAAGMPILEPGESAVFEAFDPMTMKVGEATIECVGTETIEVDGVEYSTRVYTTAIGAITSRAWVAPDEEVIQATTPFGFTLRKITPEIAGAPIPAGDRGDMVQSLAVIPSGIPVSENATRLRVRVSGVAPETVPHDPPWQQRDGDVLEIRQPAPLPESGPDRAADPPEFDPAPYLAGDPLVAVNHPTVTARANAIAGDETDPWQQARLLHDWLFENLEKQPVLSIPNALEVLKTRQGDCNEHTVLFTALARSLDIPCRIAIGVVYSETLGGFGYHAWPEVYHGGWYPMDPTLGQVAADATHIKLFNGNIDTWPQLVGFIGQMELEVLDVE